QRGIIVHAVCSDCPLPFAFSKFVFMFGDTKLILFTFRMRSGGPIMIKKRTILVAAVIWLSLCTSLFAEEKDDRNWKDEA
ncbi:MAG: hypothetical protein P8Y38_13840, partial [Deltaproteobacteria bacterium]